MCVEALRLCIPTCGCSRFCMLSPLTLHHLTCCCLGQSSQPQKPPGVKGEAGGMACRDSVLSLLVLQSPGRASLDKRRCLPRPPPAVQVGQQGAAVRCGLLSARLLTLFNLVF